MHVIDHGIQRLAPDTHLARLVLASDGPELAMQCHSMVITGAEPVLVDVGPRVARRQWFDLVGSVVDLADVRWVFLSHDEADHVGNLSTVLSYCPRATVVTSWLASHRMSPEIELPPVRQRWLRDGEAFRAGDRRLVAIRPPMYDAPTTRGLLDTSSGVYWAADAFGSTSPVVVDDVAALDPATWERDANAYSSWLSPWHELVDPARWRAEVRGLRTAGVRTIASAHGPAIAGPMIDRVLDLAADLAGRPPVNTPGQFELEELLAGVA
jgi:flavorubredoxin